MLILKNMWEKKKKETEKNLKKKKFIDGGSLKSGNLTFLKLEIESDAFKVNETNEKELYIYLFITQYTPYIQNVRIDLYPYEMPYSLPYNLPLLSNEIFIETINKNSVYTLLFNKKDNYNYNENNQKIRFEFVRPLINQYEISFEHDLQNNPKYQNETDIVKEEDPESKLFKPYYYGKQRVFLEPKLKNLYMLSNIKTKNDKDTYIFNFRYNKYDIVEDLQEKDVFNFEVEGSIQDILYKVDVISPKHNNAQVVIIINAYKKEDITNINQNPDLNYLSLNLLFNNDLKPIDTIYRVYYKDKERAIRQKERTNGIKEEGDYYFTCVTVVIDNEREEYFGYKAIQFFVEDTGYFGRLWNYIKNHIFSSILILIIIIFSLGMVIIVYRNEKKAEKLKKVDKILDEAKEMKEGLINN